MLEKLIKLIDKSNNIVFFGGAGVSTASGIPDFRSAKGLYTYNPEYMLSYTFYRKNTREFFDFYRNNMIYLDVKANITHKVLAKLEEMGKLKGIITQNIDGLHQMAGSKNVLELHGSIYRNYCELCREPYGIGSVMVEGIPHCTCGGIIRPGITLYEESLNEEVFTKAEELLEKADLIIVAGTSLVVYPAASLIKSQFKKKLILINKTSTDYDNMANILLNKDMTFIFEEIDKKINSK